MISEDKFGLRPIWNSCLEIYKEIAKICDKHGLRYYATDGTALGAVRHKGYIPWDDDFDMSMPRPDYEKFKEIAAQELPVYLKFVDFHNTPEFHLLFGKVQDTRRELVEDIEKKVGHELSNGSFVDILPIDGYPDSCFKKVMDRLTDFVLRQSLSYRYVPWTKRRVKGRLLAPLGFLFTVLFPKYKTWVNYLAAYERLLLSNNYDSCQNTGRSCSALTIYRRAPLKKDAWGAPIPYEFEDTSIMLPNNADAHLRNEYYQWDYMQLPPPEKQHPTHTYAKRCAWWLGPTNTKAE